VSVLIGTRTVVIKDGSRDAGWAAARQIALGVAGLARMMAPVDTGALVASIGLTQVADGIEVGTNGTGIGYSLFQEVGFRHYISGQWIPGQHYLQRALDMGAG